MLQQRSIILKTDMAVHLIHRESDQWHPEENTKDTKTVENHPLVKMYLLEKMVQNYSGREHQGKSLMRKRPSRYLKIKMVLKLKLMLLLRLPSRVTLKKE